MPDLTPRGGGEAEARAKVAMLFEAWRELAGELVPDRDDPASDARLRVMESNALDAYRTAVRATRDAEVLAMVEGAKMTQHKDFCRLPYNHATCDCGIAAWNAALDALARKVRGEP